jgi:hypothetical protein
MYQFGSESENDRWGLMSGLNREREEQRAAVLSSAFLRRGDVGDHRRGGERDEIDDMVMYVPETQAGVVGRRRGDPLQRRRRRS